MQQKEQLLAIKKPSKTLERLTDKCVLEFGKLNVAVNKALERGRLEGFEDRQVGDMIRRKMIAAGYSRMTVSRALPPSAKHMEKARKNINNGSNKSGNKMLPKPSAEPLNKLSDKDKIRFGNKMLPNLEGVSTELTPQILGFTARISRMGLNRRVICVPTYLYTNMSKFEDKQIRVEIKPLV